jgi:cytochrome c peroxidase
MIRVTLLVLASTLVFLLLVKAIDSLAPSLEDRTASVIQDPRLARFIDWHDEYQRTDGNSNYPISLSYLRGLSRDYSAAKGETLIDFTRGVVEITIQDLPQRDDALYEAILIDNKPGPSNSAALDWGPGGDDVISLGLVPTEETQVRMRTTVGLERLRDFEVDMVAVINISPKGEDGIVIGGFSTLFHKTGRRLSAVSMDPKAPLGRGSLGWLKNLFPNLTSLKTVDASVDASTLTGQYARLIAQVSQGEALFFQETFDGNGRTCSTCHRLSENFSIDATVIGSLPADDPLFVFETNPNLANLENGTFLRGPRGLTLENIDGFSNAPVFRAPPHLLNLDFTGPYGLNGDVATLAAFSSGAVTQHFPLTLDRVAGVDFRTPTQAELDAMEAFQLSIFLPTTEDFDLDQLVTTAAQQRGRDLFFGNGAKCSQCHGGTVLSEASLSLGSGNKNFNTGVVNLPINSASIFGFGPLPAEAEGLREFSTPELFGVKDTGPFFHDNSATTLREAVAFYVDIAFVLSPSNTTVGGIAMTQDDIDDVVEFLEALVEPPTVPVVSITGTVTLQGRTISSNGGEGHGLSIVKAEPGSFSTSVRRDGTFEFPNMPDDTYTLTASATGFLPAERTGVVVAGAGVAVPAVELAAGLVDSNTVISIHDISALAASIGATQCCRRDAQGRLTDLDGDGIVNITDLDLAASNFGAAGPAIW